MNFYVLAGGRSTRMGRNKALLPVGRQTLIETVLSALPCPRDNVKLLTNSPNDYSFLGLGTVPDIHPGIGPIAGIQAGLLQSGSARNFFVACDMPLLTTEVVQSILDEDDDADVTVPRSGTGLEPLCAVYSRACLPEIEIQISRGEYGLQRLLARVNCHVLEMSGSSALTNVNAPDDYRQITEREP